MDNKIILFQEKQVRRAWHNDEWYFSIIDIIEILTENTHPSRYWQDLKRKSAKTEGQLYDFIVKFKFLAQDGKMYATT
jgi:prophage antirepressor-like protein